MTVTSSGQYPNVQAHFLHEYMVDRLAGKRVDLGTKYVGGPYENYQAGLCKRQTVSS